MANVGPSSGGGGTGGGSMSGGSSGGTSGGTGGGSSGGAVPSLSLPDWVRSLRPLAAVAGVLVAFAEDPLGFIRAYLAQIAAGWAADIVDSVIAAVLDVASVLGRVVADAGDVVIDGLLLPVTASGGLLISTHETFASAVQTLGPLAPAGMVVLYAAELYAVFAAFDAVLSVGVFGLGQSIPVVGGVFATAGAFYEWLKQRVGDLIGVVR